MQGMQRNNAKEAEQFASDYEFEQAEEAIKKAKDDLNQAHQIQTDLIQSEARGENQQFGLIMVHAQDHLSMAMMAIDHANSMIKLYQKLISIRKRKIIEGGKII